jgi:excisionase family DNA binding protein
MERIPITFDQLPDYVADIDRKIDTIIELLSSQKEGNLSNIDRWLTIQELCEYLPGYPAIATIYRKAQRGEIPFSRTGKRLIFRKSEIDTWLLSQHQSAETM